MEATRFELVRDNKGFHARFWTGGNIIWWTESYTSKANAKHAVALIISYAAAAPFYDLT